MSEVATGVPAKAAYPKVRRMKFRFEKPASSDRYFIPGDMVFSHFVAALSASFPPGEEAFIRSVRHFSDQITDPVLKKRVAGFIGQEAVHGQEHRRLNEKLLELGYPVGWMDSPRQLERQLRFEQRIGGKAHLALTAAAEHYTAVLAGRLLTSEELQSIPGDLDVWNLLNWHAYEELEHKSVAFDVYRAVGGTERVRIAVMFLMIGMTIVMTYGGLAISLARDPIARRHPILLARQARALFRGPVFRGLLRELAGYMKPGFHPNDVDTQALLEEWQVKLFGTDGALVDRVK